MEDSELEFHRIVTKMYSPQRAHFFQTIKGVANYILKSADICLIHEGDYDGWKYFSKSDGTTNDVLYDTLEVTAGNRKYLETEVNGILKFVGYHKKLYFEEEMQMWLLVGPNDGGKWKDGGNVGEEQNDCRNGDDDVLDSGNGDDDVLDSGNGDDDVLDSGNGNDDVLDSGNGNDDVCDGSETGDDGEDSVSGGKRGKDDSAIGREREQEDNPNGRGGNGSATGDDDWYEGNNVREKGENTVSGGKRGRDDSATGREGEQDNLNGHKRSRNGSATGAGEVRRSGRVPFKKKPVPEWLQITLTKKQGQTKKQGRKRKKRLATIEESEFESVPSMEISLHEWLLRIKRDKLGRKSKVEISIQEWLERIKRDKLGRKSKDFEGENGSYQVQKSGNHLSEKEAEESNLSPSQENQSSDSDFSHQRHDESGDSSHSRHDGQPFEGEHGSEYLIFPVCDVNHYILLIFSVKNWEMLILDSYDSDSVELATFWEHASKVAIMMAENVLYIRDFRRLKETKVSCYAPSNIPRQHSDNGNCGVHLVMLLDAFMQGLDVMKLNWTDEDVNCFRYRMAAELVMRT